jgi:hypothetical protein
MDGTPISAVLLIDHMTIYNDNCWLENCCLIRVLRGKKDYLVAGVKSQSERPKVIIEQESYGTKIIVIIHLGSKVP